MIYILLFIFFIIFLYALSNQDNDSKISGASVVDNLGAATYNLNKYLKDSNALFLANSNGLYEWDYDSTSHKTTNISKIKILELINLIKNQLRQFNINKTHPRIIEAEKAIIYVNKLHLLN